MRRTTFLLAALVIFTFSINAQTAVSTADVKNFVNQDTTVTGVATQINASNSGVVFINMDGKYPDNVFSAVIYKEDAEKFPDVKDLEGKTVQVKGKIVEYNGKYNIILKDPSQLTVVEKTGSANPVTE